MAEPETLLRERGPGRPAPHAPPAGRGRGPSRGGWARRHPALLACAATGAVHLLFLSRRLGSDEGGFAMVARHWHQPGGYLYGPQWVDRPPALPALFDLADHLGPYGVRLVATMAAVALVAATALAARISAGRVAAGWAAWTAFAFASSVLLDAHQLNGELAAAPWVALSFAGVLAALRRERGPGGAVLSAAGAGAAAAVALLTKQNFADGLVFAAVLLGATAARRPSRGPGRVALVAGAFAAGVLTVVAAAVLWATRHGGVGSLLYAMYGFRRDASAVIAGWSWTAPLDRLGYLAAAAAVSGLVVLAVHLLSAHHRRLLDLSPVALALTVTGLVEVFGIVGGGNFWLHYLLALVPTVALATGLAARAGQSRARRARRLVVGAVLLTAVVSPAYALVETSSPSAPYTTGRWLAGASRPGDTLVVPYTHANVIGASGLTPVYPYSWSLPLRTLDPRLRLLTRTLDGSARPTWVVVWDDLQTWGLDPDHRVEGALHRHYRPVARVCGREVWLRDGVHRSVPPEPPAGAC